MSIFGCPEGGASRHGATQCQRMPASAVQGGRGGIPTLSDGQSIHKKVGPLAAVQVKDNARCAVPAAQRARIVAMTRERDIGVTNRNSCMQRRPSI